MKLSYVLAGLLALSVAGFAASGYLLYSEHREIDHLQGQVVDLQSQASVIRVDLSAQSKAINIVHKQTVRLERRDSLVEKAIVKIVDFLTQPEPEQQSYHKGQ
jgi:hypothetical protein